MNKYWLTTKQAMALLGVTLSQFRTLRKNKRLTPFRPTINLKNELQLSSLGNVLIWKRSEVEALRIALKNEVEAIPVR